MTPTKRSIRFFFILKRKVVQLPPSDEFRVSSRFTSSLLKLSPVIYLRMAIDLVDDSRTSLFNFCQSAATSFYLFIFFSLWEKPETATCSKVNGLFSL